LHQDIVSLGLIKQLEISYDDQKVSFSLHSLTSDLRNSEFFITMAKKVLKEIGWVANVSINLDHQSEQVNNFL
jgi:metal-sulfur cluster biosynthetic enzyme